jgi:hypothetical protein
MTFSLPHPTLVSQPPSHFLSLFYSHCILNCRVLCDRAPWCTLLGARGKFSSLRQTPKAIDSLGGGQQARRRELASEQSITRGRWWWWWWGGG